MLRLQNILSLPLSQQDLLLLATVNLHAPVGHSTFPASREFCRKAQACSSLRTSNARRREVRESTSRSVAMERNATSIRKKLLLPAFAVPFGWHYPMPD